MAGDLQGEQPHARGGKNNATDAVEAYIHTHKYDWCFEPYHASITVKKPGSDKIYGFALDAGSHLELFDLMNDQLHDQCQFLGKQVVKQWNGLNRDASRCGMRQVRQTFLGTQPASHAWAQIGRDSTRSP